MMTKKSTHDQQNFVLIAYVKFNKAA